MPAREGRRYRSHYAQRGLFVGLRQLYRELAVSMNMDVRAFADAAIHAKAPVDWAAAARSL